MLEQFRLRLSRLAEFSMAALLAVIFITFLLQIFARYAPNLAFLVPIERFAVWLGRGRADRMDCQPNFPALGLADIYRMRVCDF